MRQLDQFIGDRMALGGHGKHVGSFEVKENAVSIHFLFVYIFFLEVYPVLGRSIYAAGRCPARDDPRYTGNLLDTSSRNPISVLYCRAEQRLQASCQFAAAKRTIVSCTRAPVQ